MTGASETRAPAVHVAVTDPSFATLGTGDPRRLAVDLALARPVPSDRCHNSEGICGVPVNPVTAPGSRRSARIGSAAAPREGALERTGSGSGPGPPHSRGPTKIGA